MFEGSSTRALIDWKVLPLSFHEWLGVGYSEGEIGKIDREEEKARS
jgi:hypothetical protein